MERKRCLWGALVAAAIGACTPSTAPRLAADDDALAHDGGLEPHAPDVSQHATALTTPTAVTARELVAPDDDTTSVDTTNDDATRDDTTTDDATSDGATSVEATSWEEPSRDPIDALLSFDDVERALAMGLPDPRGLPMHRVALRRLDPRTGHARLVEASAFVLAEGDRAITLEGIVEPIFALGEPRDPRQELTRIEASWRDWDPREPLHEPGLLVVLWLDQALVGDPWRAERREAWRDVWDLHFLVSVERALEALALRDDHTAVEHGRLARTLLEAGLHDPRLVSEAFRASWVELLLDLERRERELDEGASSPPIDLEHASIATLVEQLDELDGPPSSLSSRTVIVRHPRGRALIARGSAAIEPLLEAYVHDTRVTRIVRAPHAVVTVSYAALNLVQAIADLAPAEPGLAMADLVDDVLAKRASPDEIAARVRTFLAARAGLAPHERWYLALRDGPDRDRAAWMITRPRQLARAESDTRPHTRVDAKAEGLAGEPLRDARRPSVSELLAARVVRHRHRVDCVALARLTRWDPPRATEVRARLSRRYRPRDRCE
jgi:hypothetical protein